MIPENEENDLIYKWRLILGPVQAESAGNDDSISQSSEESDDQVEEEKEETSEQKSEEVSPHFMLDEESQKVDRALSLLFDKTENDVLKRSKVRLNDWLQDIRELFPHQQTLFLQKEAIDRMGIGALLFEKEVFDSLTPDLELIRTILELKDQIPPDRVSDIRELVRRYAQEVEEKIRWSLQNSLSHHFEKGNPTVFPHKNEIDWPKTIKRNLRYYQSSLQSIMLKKKYGYQKKKRGFPVIYLAVDSSGSMINSMISTAIIASILVHIRTIDTRLILFDHEIADLSDHLENIVDLLFHIKLGGGTNIQGALNYLHDQMKSPEETFLFLISDLYDNRTDEGVYHKIQELRRDGVTVHCILSLDDAGTFRYNKPLANSLVDSGIPCYSSSPDQFADTLKEALQYST